MRGFQIHLYTSRTWSRLLHSPVNGLPEAEKEELRVVLEKGENIGSDEYDKCATDLRAHISIVWLIRLLYALRLED